MRQVLEENNRLLSQIANNIATSQVCRFQKCFRLLMSVCLCMCVPLCFVWCFICLSYFVQTQRNIELLNRTLRNINIMLQRWNHHPSSFTANSSGDNFGDNFIWYYYYVFCSMNQLPGAMSNMPPVPTSPNEQLANYILNLVIFYLPCNAPMYIMYLLMIELNIHLNLKANASRTNQLNAEPQVWWDRDQDCLYFAKIVVICLIAKRSWHFT